MCVEARMVRADRAHPDRDGVRRGTQLVYEPTRFLARDPTPAGQRDAAVECHRNLVGHERAAERLPGAPCLVLTQRGWVVEELDVDPGRAELLDPSGGDRIRIERTDHDARDTGGDHRVRARRRPPVVRAGERHVGVGPRAWSPARASAAPRRARRSRTRNPRDDLKRPRRRRADERMVIDRRDRAPRAGARSK
jgi:hypothetical protein